MNIIIVFQKLNNCSIWDLVRERMTESFLERDETTRALKAFFFVLLVSLNNTPMIESAMQRNFSPWNSDRQNDSFNIHSSAHSNTCGVESTSSFSLASPGSQFGGWIGGRFNDWPVCPRKHSSGGSEINDGMDWVCMFRFGVLWFKRPMPRTPLFVQILKLGYNMCSVKVNFFWLEQMRENRNHFSMLTAMFPYPRQREEFFLQRMQNPKCVGAEESVGR